MFDTIKERFNMKFEPWNIFITDDELGVGRKELITNEWHLKWVVQRDEKGVFLEYYGVHREQGHIHGRIEEDGAEEMLDVIKEYIMYSPNVPGDRERNKKKSDRINRELLRDLKKKGLM